MPSNIELLEGPTVRPSLWLHFHACQECAHSWSCISSTCLAMRGIIRPGQREPHAGLTRESLSDTCKRCLKGAT